MVVLTFDCIANTSDCYRAIRNCRLDLSKHIEDEEVFFNKYVELYAKEKKEPLEYDEIRNLIGLQELANKIAHSLFLEPSDFTLFAPYRSQLNLVRDETELPRYCVNSDKRVSWLGPYAYVHEYNSHI